MDIFARCIIAALAACAYLAGVWLAFLMGVIL
jgi:hypothetical protein